MKEKEKKESSWYIDLILSIILLIFIFYLFIDYEDTVAIDSIPTGKGGKAMALIIRHLDNIGGKPLVFSIILLIAVPFFISTFKKIRRQVGKK